ncbi:MAG: KH domain-containing protein [Candidatus Aenigmarchaeota archaeon]|nr:KH domain-containing protein [Candidatus Aenigmarchaeota archaeon]
MEEESEIIEEKTETIEKEEKIRKVVIPGDMLGTGRAGHGTYEENGTVYSKVVGLMEKRDELIFVIPLCGIYNPKRGDGVIGRIDEISFSKWIVDINSPYQAVLPLSEAVDEFVDLTKTDLTRFFSYNDMVFAEISSVTKTKSVQLSMKDRKCRKLRGGRLIKVTPAKVPRIIGRGGSMVEMVKELTGTQIVVGQNGLVWVKGDNEDIAAEAVLEIEQKSHIHGLTDQIKNMLTEKMQKGDINEN